DKMAPVVRTAPDGVRELTMMRWGFPPPSKATPKPVTNVRHTNSNFWRPWLQADHRITIHHQGRPFRLRAGVGPTGRPLLADALRPPFHFASANSCVAAWARTSG